MKKDFTLVIPAAGKGSRMMQPIPKGLTPFGKTTLLSYQIEKFSFLGCKIVLVVAPEHEELFLDAIHRFKNEILLTTQTILDGTARAISGALDNCDTEIVVTCWVDQVGASLSIVEECIAILRNESDTVVVVPLVECDAPYVKASIEAEELIGWNYQREGAINTRGFSDVGIFAFRREIATKVLGQIMIQRELYSKVTNEINFLDAIPYFRDHGKVKLVYSEDQDLMQSFNTQKELKNIRGNIERTN